MKYVALILVIMLATFSLALLPAVAATGPPAGKTSVIMIMIVTPSFDFYSYPGVPNCSAFAISDNKNIYTTNDGYSSGIPSGSAMMIAAVEAKKVVNAPSGNTTMLTAYDYALQVKNYCTTDAYISGPNEAVPTLQRGEVLKYLINAATYTVVAENPIRTATACNFLFDSTNPRKIPRVFYFRANFSYYIV